MMTRHTAQGRRETQLRVLRCESLRTEPVLTERNGLHLNCSGSSSHLGSEVEGGAGGGKWVARENNIYS